MLAAQQLIGYFCPNVGTFMSIDVPGLSFDGGPLEPTDRRNARPGGSAAQYDFVMPLEPPMKGDLMVELIEIGDEHDVLADDEDWVLIEKVGNKFVANGSPGGRMIATFFKPDPFDTAEEAIKACSVWAEANGVARVYVKGEG